MVAFYSLVTCCLITVAVSTDAYLDHFYSLQFCYQTKEDEWILVNYQLDAQFFFMYVYFYFLHVSGRHVPIIRRINCINTTSGICLSVYMTVSCAHQTVIYTEWHIPYVVLIQFTLILQTWKTWRAPNNASRWQMGFNSVFTGLILLMMGTCLPETYREKK
jgi:hypothetical protein